MLSILIPTYNYKCYTLVFDLQRQLQATGEEYEIIVAEDGGKDQVASISNHRINELPQCRYIRRQQNVGRAAIRNYLAAEAHGDWLLFMDSDAEVIRPDYISKYIAETKKGYSVIRGGIRHTDICPSTHHTLRWKYEKAFERKHGGIGNTFTAFNFMIRRDVFLSVRFDENYKGYGGEDTKFGIDLQRKGIDILRTDNPLLHKGLDTNDIYLNKVEAALRSLYLHRFEQKNTKLVRFVREHNIYSHIAPMIYHITKPLLRRNLLGANPNIKLLAFYKLGYYLTQK